MANYGRTIRQLIMSLFLAKSAAVQGHHGIHPTGVCLRLPWPPWVVVASCLCAVQSKQHNPLSPTTDREYSLGRPPLSIALRAERP